MLVCDRCCSSRREGGAGAQYCVAPEVMLLFLSASCILLPMAMISPLELIACASIRTTPRAAEAALFRSLMPACLVHINARSPDELVELPTITPSHLCPEPGSNSHQRELRAPQRHYTTVA